MLFNLSINTGSFKYELLNRQYPGPRTKEDVDNSFIIIYFSCTWQRQFSVESACVSLFPCDSSYRWIHFPKESSFNYMMFWRVQNGAKKGTIPVKLHEELTEFYSELGVADCNVTQPWRQRTVDTWKKTFLVITPAFTKPGHSVLSRQAKCPRFHPYTLESRLWPMRFFKTSFSSEEAETGRAEVFNGYMVCQQLSFQSSWLFPSS